jgi:hypothetical protein
MMMLFSNEVLDSRFCTKVVFHHSYDCLWLLMHELSLLLSKNRAMFDV